MGLFKTIWTGIKTFGNSGLGQTLIPMGGKYVMDSIAAKRERNFAEDMWNKQNAYNSPTQQLARYAQAGMNPAYGAGMASGNAEKMSDSATSVARVEMPNILENMGRYQSMKNAVLEGDRIKALTEQELLKNMFLSQTLEARTALEGQKLDFMTQKKWQDRIKANWMVDLYDKGINPQLAKYNLDVQRLNQNTQMFDLDIGLKNIALNREKLGLNASDSAFLRVLAQMWNGSDKGANSMLPYVIGESAANFLGGLAKNAIPKIPFQKYKFQTNPNVRPFTQNGRTYWEPIQPNYNF